MWKFTWHKSKMILLQCSLWKMRLYTKDIFSRHPKKKRKYTRIKKYNLKHKFPWQKQVTQTTKVSHDFNDEFRCLMMEFPSLIRFYIFLWLFLYDLGPIDKVTLLSSVCTLQYVLHCLFMSPKSTFNNSFTNT